MSSSCLSRMSDREEKKFCAENNIVWLFGAVLFDQIDTFATQHLCELSPLTTRIPNWIVPFLQLEI
jgi:hypothetical protein